MGAAIAVNPKLETVTVFAFVEPTSLMVCFLTGSAGLREHRDRREREQLRQAIYYRALNEKADETSRMSQRIVDLLRYNHDAGNTLSSVFLNAQFLEERLRLQHAPEDEARELALPMSRLLEQLQRLKALIGGAHRVADELPVMGEVSVHDSVAQVVDECRAAFPNVRVVVRDSRGNDLRVLVHDG